MLTQISIRDVVVIQALDVEFQAGFTALTGETGSGKSILLDAVGLAIGMRADSALIRKGADKATVTAEFQLPRHHPARALLAEQDIDCGDTLILRRVLGTDGKSRAFANDHPIGVQLLKQLGQSLLELQGQFAQHGLLDPATHRQQLDNFGDLAELAAAVKTACAAWQDAEKSWQHSVAEQAALKTQEDYLRHAITELRAFEPKSGEETALAERRIGLQHREKIVAALAATLQALVQEDGADRQILAAQKAIGRIVDKMPQTLEPILQSLANAADELQTAQQTIEAILGDDRDVAGELATLEDRLFGLRDLSRKYNIPADQLPDLLAELTAQLDKLDRGSQHIDALQKALAAAQAAYHRAAEKLGAARRSAAKKLDAAIQAELAPLKLADAVFTTAITPLAEADFGPNGIDAVEFTIRTNPGQPAGPLHKIASGGELSRFMLALQVVLAATQPIGTLIFDEIDTGVSGAVADAVGARLAKLGRKTQVLLVTHSPQVAAKADHHYRLGKQTTKTETRTVLDVLDATARREELAKMLSGAAITAEARAQAEKLLGAA
jgi:DNA repair protein RecN (Recombination protein N)